MLDRDVRAAHEHAKNGVKAVATTSGRSRYEPPRVVKGRLLKEVTGQGAVVPSGAPGGRN